MKSREERPLVTIITLNYNGRRFLGNLFDSLRKCSYPNLEIIMVDNCSRDDSVAFVRKNYPATGSLDKRIQSQISAEGDFKRIQIKVDTLDKAMSTYSLNKPDFIKIDIEGLEYQALIGMSQIMHDFCPQFYIEIHGAGEASKRENIHRIVELFQAQGYSIWHVETQQTITLSNYEVAKSGHIYCKLETSS